MDELHATLARLEARIDHQEDRIDALQEVLERRGILPSSVRTNKERPTRRQPTRLHVGTATGV
jgi:hypothetical protein